MKPWALALACLLCCAAAGVDSALATNGPDVIVGEIIGTQRYGREFGITAYSIGTTSCNLGDENLLWIAETSQHPVIAQNIYRLKDGRLEQVGMSWLKHGFAATNEEHCFPCVHPGTDTVLAPNCSDPYVAALNGNQMLLGPRSEVNASTGVFPYPFTAPPPTPPLTLRRIQAKDADIDPDLNPGASYLLEGHYITADDAAAGNDNNNASYRRATIVEATPPSTIFNITLVGLTQPQKPAIVGWQDIDPTVAIVNIDVPGDGRLILGAKATDTGDGFWNYEYALYNMNSHRSARSFSLPMHPETAVSNLGFHDIDYHSGEPYSPTDWPGIFSGGTISWSTEDFSANANANALRWGTLYNFRFRSNSPPVANCMITVGLFRPGSPASMTMATLGPAPVAPDCNNNATPDYQEIDLNPSLDCDTNGNLDACDFDCDGNNVPDACDISANTSLDCDGSGILDSCEIASLELADCNTNLRPDICEIPIGSPAPGGPFYCTSACDPDCNVNGIPDSCDIAGSLEDDCDGNTVPDSCQINQNPGLDCNNNGLLDSCGEIDCNANTIPDDCEGPACPGIVKGDMDCTGSVNMLDIPPFVEAILNVELPCQTDMNSDGSVNGRDLQGFTDAL